MAAILELDEHLSRNFKVGFAASAVSIWLMLLLYLALLLPSKCLLESVHFELASVHYKYVSLCHGTTVKMHACPAV